jgi:tetratricopeptide (TPR) repeat protein
MIESDGLEYFDSEQLERIIDHFCEQENISKINRAFELYKQLYPFSTQIDLKKAQVLLFFEKANEALEVLSNIHYSKNEEYIYTLSAVYSKLHEHQKAISYLEELLELNPNNEEVIFSLANEFQKIEEYAKSNDMFELLLTKQATKGFSWYAYLMSVELENNIDRAVRFIKNYISSNPYDHEAWYYLGSAYQNKEDYLNAIESFDYSICINEKYTIAYTNKAECLSELGYYDLAIECFMETFTFNEPDAFMFYEIGHLYEKSDQLEKAKSYFYKSIRKDEEFDESWFSLALILDLQGFHLEASYHIKKAVDLFPSNIDYLFSFAQIHEKVGFIKEAEMAYKKVLELDELDSETWLNYTHLLSQNESHLEAIEQLKKAIKINPKNAELSYRLTAYLFQSGQDQMALNIFKEALIINFEKHEDLFHYLPSVKTNKNLLNLLSEHKK